MNRGAYQRRFRLSSSLVDTASTARASMLTSRVSKQQVPTARLENILLPLIPAAQNQGLLVRVWLGDCPEPEDLLSKERRDRRFGTRLRPATKAAGPLKHGVREKYILVRH